MLSNVDVVSAMLVDSLERQLDPTYNPNKVLYTLVLGGVELIPPDKMDNVIKYLQRGAHVPQLEGVCDASICYSVEQYMHDTYTIVRCHVCN